MCWTGNLGDFFSRMNGGHFNAAISQKADIPDESYLVVATDIASQGIAQLQDDSETVNSTDQLI